MVIFWAVETGVQIKFHGFPLMYTLKFGKSPNIDADKHAFTDHLLAGF